MLAKLWAERAQADGHRRDRRFAQCERRRRRRLEPKALLGKVVNLGLAGGCNPSTSGDHRPRQRKVLGREGLGAEPRDGLKVAGSGFEPAGCPVRNALGA